MTALDSVPGYRLTVPAGWQRVTTGDGSKESVDRLIRWQLRKRSRRDRVLPERSLRELMPRLVADAKAAGALEFFGRWNRRAPSVAEYRSLVSAQVGVSVDLATMESATLGSRDATALLRQEEAAGRVLPSTRVSYLVPVPASPGAILRATFTCDDSALSSARVFMFDAIVSTLTWESE